MKFIESICYQNGGYFNLKNHQERVNRTFSNFFSQAPPKLTKVLPQIEDERKYKIRMVYDAETVDIEYAEYHKKAIQSLKLVESEPFNYSFKFEDRTKIHSLVNSSLADEIIICIDGLITDSSYSNLAFWNGEEWLTPENPLLKGVRRAQLLAEEKIRTYPVHIADLNSFEKVSFINAMLDLEELVVPISSLQSTS